MSLIGTARQMRRRLTWLQRGASAGAVANLASAGMRYLLHAERAAALPPMVKIDISPLCALACPACIHADPKGRHRPLLERQSFQPTQRMARDRFAAIIEQIRGRALAVSLYYYGDPLMHPEFAELAGIAADAGLSTHASTHLSYNLSEAKLAAIVASGLSHLTVTIDGATQETYGVTRVRGRLVRVLDNLERLISAKRARGLAQPVIEVQYLRHPHHAPNEADRVEALARERGADQFTAYDGAYHDVDGDLYNAVDTDLGAQSPGAARGGALLPRCHWPYTGTVIKYDGDVIPCCKWRDGQQYSGGDPRAIGNIFETPLAEIWNGETYRRLRRLTSDPAGADARGEGRGSFCEGCPRLYATPSRLGAWEAA